MREILFRGKYDQSSEFTYGDLIHGVGTKYNKMYILPNVINLAKVKNCHPLDGVSVIPETIGQYTGLKDKNGTKIFENDIVGGYPHGNVVVKWNDKWACFESYSTEIHFDDDGEPFEKYITTLFSNDLKDCFNEWEVLGNIHDNPELLKGE